MASSPAKLAYDRAWRKRNRPRTRVNSQRWKERNPSYMPVYARNRNLKRKYGITTKEWDDLFCAQGHCCAACGTSNPGSRMGWHTDHRGPKPCKKNDIRGILCLHCNHAARLGTANDITRLRALADYLEKWQ